MNSPYKRLPLIVFFASCGSPAPVVTASSPAPGAVDVALDTKITLELSELPTDELHIDLSTAQEESVAVDVELDDVANTITITPREPLALLTDYTLTAVRDEEVDHDNSFRFTSSFSTREGTWRNAPLLQQSTPGPLTSEVAPSLAILPDGTGIASWASRGDLLDQRFTPQDGWYALAHQDKLGEDPGNVEIAADSSTSAVAAYPSYKASGTADIVARTLDGVLWPQRAEIVAPSQVNSTDLDQYIGGVAQTPSTTALTFHRGSFATDHFDPFVAMRRDGTWSLFPVAQLPGSALTSRIVVDAAGEFGAGYVILWVQRSPDLASTAVWMTTLSKDGTLGTPQLLDDGPGATFSLTAVRGGNTVWLAWSHEEPNTKLRITVRPLRDATGLGEALTIDQDGYPAVGDFVQIAATASEAEVVYTHFSSVQARHYKLGVWSAPTELEPMSTNRADLVRCPVISLDDHDNATVVWTRLPAAGRRSTVVARGHAQRWSATVQLDTGSGDSQVWGTGVDSAGRVSALLTESDPNHFTIWAAQLQ